ncbi:MAG: PAS domain S-box protein, partial [Solirubrobacteraceae bacterium]
MTYSSVLAERVARIYATLAKADAAILRIRQRLPLFEEVCRVLVEEGRLRMARVGEIDDQGWIVSVAHAGAAQGYFDDLRVSVLDVAEGRGPTGIAARERDHVFTTDIATDARMAPWRDAALAREFRSSAGFPLVVDDRCVAVLTAYASEPGFFDEEEVALFDRMAADLSFALDAMARDERRRAVEAQLGASEERYRRALSALSEGIVVQGKDGAISSCNPAAERILGLSADQMMGVSSLDPRWRAVHEDGSPFPGEEHPAMVTLRTGTPLEGVIMGVHKPDGSLSWISINSMPFRAGSDDAGEDAVVTTFTDITTRRAAEARLRESEERFQAAIRMMQDGVAILSSVRDETGEIVDFRYDYANDAYCELVGRDRKQLLARRVGGVFPDWLRSERFEVFRQVALTGTPFRTEDFHPEQAWGAEFARRVLDSVVARAGEQLVVSARDVSDRRRAEAQLGASEERFDAAVGSMLDAFAILSPVRDEQGEIVDFRWEYVNDAYCELVELDRDRLIGQRLSERYPGWPTSERLVVYRGVSETGEPCLSVDVAEPEAWAGGRLANRVLDTMIVAAGEHVVVTARDVTERHRLEEQLRASEELFRTGVGSLLDGFTICSPVRDQTGEIIDFRWQYANDAACARNELTRERMLGQRISEVLPGYTDSDVFKLHRRVAQTGEPARVDEVSWQAEWVAGRQVDRAYDGSVVPLGPNIIVTGRDVSEARRNERELRLQAELLELAHDAVIVRDPVESRVTFWNREAEAIYGYSRAEALGQVTNELLATVFPESRQAVDHALAHEGRWRGELRHTRKDGRVIVVSSRQALQHDEDGRPLAIIELNSDITERKRAEADLAHVKGLLERTQEISKTGGWEYDVATGKLTWTDEVYRIYGVEKSSDPTEVTEAIAAYDPESAPIIDAAFKRLVADGEPYDLELGLIRADRERISVRTIGRPVIEDGRVVRIGGNIVDVTERNRNELALRQAREQLELAQRIAELGSFSTNPASGETVWSAEMFRIFGRDPAAANTAGRRSSASIATKPAAAVVSRPRGDQRTPSGWSNACKRWGSGCAIAPVVIVDRDRTSRSVMASTLRSTPAPARSSVFPSRRVASEPPAGIAPVCLCLLSQRSSRVDCTAG